MKLENLEAVCFLCGTSSGVFDTDRRVCGCVEALGFPARERSCYVTILPEVKDFAVGDLPSLHTSEPYDLYAVALDEHGSPSESLPERGPPPPYPWKRDHLGTVHHMRCGNPIVHRSRSLEEVTGFGGVQIINLSAYQCTSTLKDPRSWAILNTALENGITDLAVWTAGNAGLSLAKMAYIVNRRLPRERRIQIHAIVDLNVASEIRTRLRVWQCEVLDIFRRDKPVLNPLEIRSLVSARMKRSRRELNDATYWDVTDGWDGVGLLMYRFLAAQIVRDIGATENALNAREPLSIVVPVGTGNLLLGFYLGLRDCEKAGAVARGAIRIVGCVPAGANILDNIRMRKIPGTADRQAAAGRGVEPLMPKLTSAHTPLAPCLAKLDQEQLVDFVTVTEHDQMRAAKHVLAGGIDDGLPCEPSALSTFAALPHLSSHYPGRDGADVGGWAYQSQRRVLVVNSGLGLLGSDEEAVLRRAIGE